MISFPLAQSTMTFSPLFSRPHAAAIRSPVNGLQNLRVRWKSCWIDWARLADRKAPSESKLTSRTSPNSTSSLCLSPTTQHTDESGLYKVSHLLLTVASSFYVPFAWPLFYGLSFLALLAFSSPFLA